MTIDTSALFRLGNQDSGKKRKFGTGFSIGYDQQNLFILTCAHVVDDLGGEVWINDEHKAEIIANGISKGVDLALLKVCYYSIKNTPSLLNCITEGKLGVKFEVCGYRTFEQNKYNLRTVTGSLGKSSFVESFTNNDRVKIWDLNITDDDFSKLQGGYSGSPLCNEEGKLIAVVTHKIGDNGQRGYAVDISNLEVIYPDIDQLVPLSFVGCTKSVNRVLVTISEEFLSFLQNAELLTKAHSQKKSVVIEDIFVYPELRGHDYPFEGKGKINSQELINKIDEYPKIIIAGENQSGKTTLCKKIYLDLYKKDYIPVYLAPESSNYAFHGKMENKIENALKKQYNLNKTDCLDKDKIIVILDDFHFADTNRREKHINSLYDYRQIIIVDDIFHLNFKDDNLIDSFAYFRIEEFVPSLRNQLIVKWADLTDSADSCTTRNLIYQRIDENTELVNATLGKIFGNGIMPSYPFFILSVISTHETLTSPLDQEITSQGYCYQALIYLCLRKNNVKNDEIEIYLNFLTELSFFFYSHDKNELSKQEFDSFIESYLDEFYLPIELDTLLDKLLKSHLIELDNLGNYSFCYIYLYYFFVAKYLAENTKKEEEVIENIIANLHKDKNAYIAIFISHHSKNDPILEEILLNAYYLFPGYKPATLNKSELNFFDKQEKLIVRAILPSSKTNHEIERDKQLRHQDIIEENNITNNHNDDEAIDHDLLIDLRRSIRTVEVMGGIIKNRAGSLNKAMNEDIFQEAMKIQLRLLSYFFNIIEKEEAQEEIVEIMTRSLRNVVDKKSKEREKNGKIERDPTTEDLEKISKTIFWNLNFFIIYSILTKTIRSLGSNKLIKIAEKICDEEGTPASFLIKHGIFMWYSKNVQIENISKRIKCEDFSNITKEIMRRMIVEHFSVHQTNFRERERISKEFNISPKRLLKIHGAV
jgi:GTPase SAR1 family protein